MATPAGLHPLRDSNALECPTPEKLGNGRLALRGSVYPKAHDQPPASDKSREAK